MAGVKGKSGRRPMSAEWHLARGTFRKDRHRRRVPSAVAGPAALAVDIPPVPAVTTAGLGEPGRAFVADVWAHYQDWPPEKLRLLHEAGAVTDALHEYAAILARDGRIVTAARGNEVLHPVVRVQAQALRSLMLLVNALGLREV